MQSDAVELLLTNIKTKLDLVNVYKETQIQWYFLHFLIIQIILIDQPTTPFVWVGAEPIAAMRQKIKVPKVIIRKK